MNIIITLPEPFEGETDIINRHFKEGLQRLHLRKPALSRDETERWLEGIETAYRSHIVLHDHFDLAVQYRLGGIHMNQRNTKMPERFSREDFTLSRSCHSLAEIERYHDVFDYLFLSPVFDSISKKGYQAAFSKEELADAKKRGLLTNVYALGGVTTKRLKEVEEMGFAGGAMLGGFWLAGNINPPGGC